MGLPGSGKTTFSEKLKTYLENNSEFFNLAFENATQRAQVRWLNADEVRDLVGYVMSGGNPDDRRYKK